MNVKFVSGVTDTTLRLKSKQQSSSSHHHPLSLALRLKLRNICTTEECYANFDNLNTHVHVRFMHRSIPAVTIVLQAFHQFVFNT